MMNMKLIKVLALVAITDPKIQEAIKEKLNFNDIDIDHNMELLVREFINDDPVNWFFEYIDGYYTNPMDMFDQEDEE